MKALVIHEDGKWWFKWYDLPALGTEGPFDTPADAETAKERFVAARKANYPSEVIELE